MLQALAIRREPSSWLSPAEFGEMIAKIDDLYRRITPARFPVKAGEGWVFLDLRKVSHFEVSHEVVQVWAGESFRTSWTTLTEVEATFPQETFLRIQRHMLIRPEAVIGFKMTLGGRGEVRLTSGHVLEVSRGAVPKLRERLGLS